MENKVEVREALVQADMNGAYILCYMSDDSIWRCDLNGDNWEKVRMTPEELTIKFNIESRRS